MSINSWYVLSSYRISLNNSTDEFMFFITAKNGSVYSKFSSLTFISLIVVSILSCKIFLNFFWMSFMVWLSFPCITEHSSTLIFILSCNIFPQYIKSMIFNWTKVMRRCLAVIDLLFILLNFKAYDFKMRSLTYWLYMRMSYVTFPWS